MDDITFLEREQIFLAFAPLDAFAFGGDNCYRHASCTGAEYSSL